MSYCSNYIQKWLLGICLLAVSSLSFSLNLNGIASFQQLRKEYYIAALYLANPNDNAADIINSNGTQRMMIKVTANKWSPRRWALTWQDNIAINNDLSAHPELLEAIMTFTQFPKSKLTKGDQLTIDYSPAFGTQIKLNGHNVVNTDNKNLFNFMLNTWLGKLPPSQTFKQRILTRQNDHEEKTLIARFDNLVVPSSRQRMVASWIESEQEKEAQRLAELERQDAEARKDKEDKAYHAALLKQKEQARKQKRLAENKRKVEQKKKQALAKARAAAKAKREAERKRAQLAAQKQANLKKAKSKKVRAEEQRYYLAHYQWELQRDAASRVTYPVWAQKFGQQGLVKLSAKINENGEVISLTHESSSVSQLLKQEAERALRESASYTFPSAKLNGKSWNVSFEYNFTLDQSPQKISAKPKRPASLKTKRLGKKAYAKMKNDYITQALEGIKVFIQYPESARVLRHRGEVTLTLTVDSSGQVIDIQDKKASRYSTLNQQLRSAIDLAAPLPPVPDELRVKSLSFDVHHEYKD